MLTSAYTEQEEVDGPGGSTGLGGCIINRGKGRGEKGTKTEMEEKDIKMRIH